MPSQFCGLRRFAFLIPLAVLAAVPAATWADAKAAKAKPRAAAPAPPAGPWLYRGSDIPHDKAWVFGELPNGVRYAVRKNGVPPGQVSIRVRMDVGSLYEQEHERGYAHLLEHLVFRQSKYLADGAAISTFQKFGATFGSDTNALTSPISTTYKLDLPGVSPATLDESFKLLSGMMIAPTLSEANVRSDVPIVLAEKRERGGTAERVGEATQQTYFAGQRLANRSPIGTVATLEAADEAKVRAFHRRWYRPENAVVIAVGDVDAAQLAVLVTRYFGDWKVPGKPTPAPPFGDPLAPKGSNPANPVGETRVLVEPELPRTLSYAVMRPWRQVRDTVVYNQGLMTGEVGMAVINRRLEARARTGGNFLAAQVSRDKSQRSANATYVEITPLDGNWKAALAEVRGVIADALASPPSEDEIQREVEGMHVIFENLVEQTRLQPGSQLADDIVGALDIRETVASPETVLDIFTRSRAVFTPAAVLRESRALFTGAVTRSVYITPSAGESDAAALRQALLIPAVPDPKARLDSKPISFAELPPVGEPGQVVADTQTGLFELSQIELANGVKALIWPSKDEPGRVTVKVRFGAGYRAFSPGDAAYIQLGEFSLVSAGESTLGEEQIDRVRTGRKIGFDFALDDASFQFSGDTRAADLGDQLYLFAAKFGMPRWDVAPFRRAQAAAKINYESYASSPQGVLGRDLRFYQRGKDPRFQIPSPAAIDAATPDGFRQVWQSILETGPIEVQIFGDFDRAGAIEALKRTFGALPKRVPLPAEALITRVEQLAPSSQPVVLTHRGDPGQAAALVSWPTGGGMADIAESRQLAILGDLFQNRLIDSLREKLGEAYSPQVGNDWPLDLDNGGSITAMGQLQTRAIPVFFATADEIAADLIAKPPSADELARVTEPLRQQLSRAATGSAFFMYQLEGATEDQRRFAAIRTILPDYTRTTPEAMQALARKYLSQGRSWRLAVIPQGQQLTTALTPRAGSQGR